jgi:hypothetical protein
VDQEVHPPEGPYLQLLGWSARRRRLAEGDRHQARPHRTLSIAAHQLDGPAKAWWDNYTTTHPNPAFITWLEFCEAFREQYLPSELLIQKV